MNDSPNKHTLPLKDHLFYWGKYIQRNWPVFVIPIIVLTPIAIPWFTICEAMTVNLWFSVAYQTVGGTVLAYGIVANLNLFSKKPLWERMVRSIRQYPKLFSYQSVTLESIPSVAKFGDITLANAPSGFDAEYEIEKLKKSHKEILNEMRQIRNSLDSVMKNTRLSIRDLNNRIADMAVGNWKWQLVGSFSVIYGVVLSFTT